MESIIADPGFEIMSVLLYSHALPASPPNTISVPGLDRFYLLTHHLERLLAAAKALNWPAVISRLEHHYALGTLATHIDHHIFTNYATLHSLSTAVYRVRIAFSKSGIFQIMSEPIPAFSTETSILFPTPLSRPFSFENSKSILSDLSASAPLTTLYIDTKSTTPSLFTTHKTTYRLDYSQAQERAGISQHPLSQSEVLLVNTEGEVMGGGFTTLYFWRLDKDTGKWGWVTPAAKSGSKLGVTRKWALEWGEVSEAVVKSEDIVDGEEVWLSCSVWGFTMAKVSVHAI